MSTLSARPVILAFSTSRLRNVFSAVAPLLAEVADVRVFDRSFENALSTVRELRESGEGADALVAAGANGAYLRDHADLPVVVVQASTVDALQAVIQARRVSPRIGIVNYRRVVAGLEQARDLLRDVEVEQRPYVTPEEARAQVASLAVSGFQVIVGPGPVCDMAEKAGLRPVLIYGQDSVAVAIREAAEIARLTRAEEARREQGRRVMDALETGVVAVDTDERVQSANGAALRLLGIPLPELLGRRLSQVAPQLGLSRVLEGGSAEADTVERVGPRTVVVGRTPLQEHGVLRGAAITLLDAAAVQRMERRLRTQHRPRRFEPRYSLASLAGSSAAMARVRTVAERYARTDATVLITGESGTGKEMVAQGIHAAGRRRDQPFVAVNCAAFPETLLEAELFGHEEGAFTGSRRGGRPGLIESAHLGTLFLDEVGDVPLTLQAKLLRVLQERQVLRLGSNEPTPVEVRIVAATHRDLRRRVDEGAFREDLYYRLHILPLHIPPLRERPEDVEAIASELLKRALVRHGAPGAHPRALAQVLPRLRAHRWPGNVRELENVLERVALLFAEGGPAEEVREEELEAAIPGEPSPAGSPPSSRRAPADDLRATRDASELAHIRRVLADCRGNQTQAARLLGIGRSTLYRKLAGRG
jgi:transcriptional regulator, propionate catabolism operon regulatory protein